MRHRTSALLALSTHSAFSMQNSTGRRSVRSHALNSSHCKQHHVVDEAQKVARHFGVRAQHRMPVRCVTLQPCDGFRQSALQLLDQLCKRACPQFALHTSCVLSMTRLHPW